MNQATILVSPLSLAISLFILAHALTVIKRLFVSESITISRQTQDGETVVLHSNFTVFDSKTARHAKTNALGSIGDERLRFCDERFKTHLQAQRAKQDTLSAVK